MAIVWKAVLLLLLLLFIFYFIFIIFGNLSSSIVIKPVLWIIPSDVVVARDFVVTCVIPGKYFSSFLQNFSVKKNCFLQNFSAKKTLLSSKNFCKKNLLSSKLFCKKTCFGWLLSCSSPAYSARPCRTSPMCLKRWWSWILTGIAEQCNTNTSMSKIYVDIQ